MLKLLLSNDRHTLRREYVFRVYNIFIIFGIIILIVNAVSFFAPYTIVYLERNLIVDEIDKIKSSDVLLRKKDFDDKHRHTMAEFRLLNHPKLLPSKFFDLISKNKPAEVVLSGYNFSKIEEDTMRVKIDIRGVAKNRDSLVQYVNSLKQEETFRSVNLPVSSLTRDAEIPFNINIETTDKI